MIFTVRSIKADVEAIMLDATIVRAHQYAAGAKKKQMSALSKQVLAGVAAV